MSRLRYSPPRWQTAGTHCANAAAGCTHHRDVHERTASGVFRKCTVVNAAGGPCTCLAFEAQEVRR